jgi:hypothetical protein
MPKGLAVRTLLPPFDGEHIAGIQVLNTAQFTTIGPLAGLHSLPRPGAMIRLSTGSWPDKVTTPFGFWTV